MGLPARGLFLGLLRENEKQKDARFNDSRTEERTETWDASRLHPTQQLDSMTLKQKRRLKHTIPSLFADRTSTRFNDSKREEKTETSGLGRIGVPVREGLMTLNQKRELQQDFDFYQESNLERLNDSRK